MTGNEIRSRFLTFFEKRAHSIVPSAPLVPENDPTVLFNTAGMQPLVPYLMGQPHPTGSKRIADSQKCVRTNDIEEVGDNTHLTFFEMLGNWSLGDYFKKEAITWSYEFLTSKEDGLGLDPKRLYVTVFEGDENAPKDEEAYMIWKTIFETSGLEPQKRIFFMDAKSNWWSPGSNGPCGPDSEMFYDVTGKLTEGLTREEFLEADERQNIVEIWNDVFMEYEKKGGQVIGKLASQNVDTGSGLERVTAMVQGVNNVFETDLFTPITSKIVGLSKVDNPRAVRIIADHLRASTFLISDGVSVSNTDQGYILRRLLRRSVQQADKLGIEPNSLSTVAIIVIEKYGEAYPNLIERRETIVKTIYEEEEQFRKTLKKGEELIIKMFSGGLVKFSGKDVFDLYQTYGYPPELTIELIKQKHLEDSGGELELDENQVMSSFHANMREHQETSRTGAAGKFKGGLADHSERVVEYHTVTHLTLAALRKFLGNHVHQAGSNITAERMRFDFTHTEKIDPTVLKSIEAWVNEALKVGGRVIIETVAKTDAASDPSIEGSFWEKYPDMVTVYTMTAPDGTVYSRELCGGPHVENLEDIKGTYRIVKEESSSAGVRRIKAVLE